MVSPYEDPRAHAVRARYLALFGGDEFPIPVERIAEDLLGLHIEESATLDCSGMLLPAERRIVLSSAEAMSGEMPIRRQRFTVAHEIGHWVCHCREGSVESPASYCRAVDLTEAAERALEREANVFAAELLMPEAAIRAAWEETPEIDHVAKRFDVSPLAAHWRLYAFGLVPEKPERAGEPS